MWGKLIESNHLLKDTVIEIPDSSLRRTQKVFKALSDICLEFDLSEPIWLDVNVAEFKRISKTRFTKDSFIEKVDFDYLEIHIIEED
jgi:hypothetical protein